MSSAPRYTPHYTVDDYRLWKGDWELWSGTAVSMTPSPFGPHSRLLGELSRVIGNAIVESNCRAQMLPEIDWVIASDTVLRPDISVVCGTRPDRHIDQTPAVVVEILSSSTRQRDLLHKREIYEQQGVPYYLIVDPDESTLTVLGMSESATYDPVSFKDALSIQICDDCDLTIDIGKLFA
jgi:Uma2 family endonuclease